MDLDAIKKSYRRYAQNYDFYFGAVFQPGRKAVIELMSCRPGETILEVGVGTGLSLSLYPKHVHVTGIDVSQEMLQKARVRKQREGLKHVELLEMDAENMTLADHSFDKVVAMYVASVVPNPRQLVAEMQRVCKPQGDIFIVNHFHSTHPVLKRTEKLIAPLSKTVGFRPDLLLDDFIRETELDVIEKVKVNLLGYWTLLRARNNTSLDAGAPLNLVPVRAVASR